MGEALGVVCVSVFNEVMNLWEEDWFEMFSMTPLIFFFLSLLR